MSGIIYKVTTNQLETLLSGESVVVNGQTYTYDVNSVYVLQNPIPPAYNLKVQNNLVVLTANGEALDSITVPFAEKSDYADAAGGANSANYATAAGKVGNYTATALQANFSARPT